MSKLKLVKGRSYTGHGVYASAEKPFIDTEDNKTADALIATGYFIFAEEVTAEKAVSKKPGNNKKKNKPSEEEYDGSDLFTEEI